jgi:hypothetical protein
VSVCSLKYRTCNTHALYYILPTVACLVLPYFSTTSLKSHDFLNKVFGHETPVLVFSAIHVLTISHSKKNWKRCCRKRKLVFMWITRYSCQILIKFQFSRIILEIFSNIKFDENPFNRSRDVPWGREDRQTDRQTDRERQSDMTDLLLAFRKFSIAPEKFIHVANYVLRSTLKVHLQICHRVTLYFVLQFIVPEHVPDLKTFKWNGQKQSKWVSNLMQPMYNFTAGVKKLYMFVSCMYLHKLYLWSRILW